MFSICACTSARCWRHKLCAVRMRDANVRNDLKEDSGREITWLSWHHRCRKAPFSKCFPSTWKWKAGVFKFLRFEERFLKAPLSRRIGVDSGPNWRNIAAFSNFSGLVWTLPKTGMFFRDFLDSSVPLIHHDPSDQSWILSRWPRILILSCLLYKYTLRDRNH